MWKGFKLCQFYPPFFDFLYSLAVLILHTLPRARPRSDPPRAAFHFPAKATGLSEIQYPHNIITSQTATVKRQIGRQEEDVTPTVALSESASSLVFAAGSESIQHATGMIESGATMNDRAMDEINDNGDDDNGLQTESSNDNVTPRCKRCLYRIDPVRLG